MAKRPNAHSRIDALDDELSNLAEKLSIYTIDAEPLNKRTKALRKRIEALEKISLAGLSNQEVERRLDPIRDRMAIVEEKVEIQEPPHINALWTEMLALRARIEVVENFLNARPKDSVATRRTEMAQDAQAFFKFGEPGNPLAPDSAKLTGGSALTVLKAGLQKGDLWTYTQHEVEEFRRNTGKTMPTTQRVVERLVIREDLNNGVNEGITGFTYWTQEA